MGADPVPHTFSNMFEIIGDKSEMTLFTLICNEHCSCNFGIGGDIKLN